jgi:putative DNA primase/helicase
MITTSSLAANIELGYALGWSFLPLRGKIPTQPGWQKRDRETLAEVLSWQGNVGLRTGKSSGVIVIDVDPGGEISLPKTVTVITGRNGRHYYFKEPDVPIGNSAGKLGDHIDVRGNGGQVVYPGSVHPDTQKTYQWELSPDDIELAELPANIIERLQKPTPSKKKQSAPVHGTSRRANFALRCALREIYQAREGTRNDTLNKAAFSAGTLIGGGYVERGAAEESLLSAALDIGLLPHEAEATIKSGIDAGINNPRTIEVKPQAVQTLPIGRYTLDLSGNTDRFMHLYGDKVHWCEQRGKWYVWDGIHWQPDASREINQMAEQTMLALKRESANGDPTIIKWAATCCKNGAARRDMLLELRHRRPVALSDFDRPAWLFNAANGTIDLQSGKLLDHDRTNMLTKASPSDYSRDGDCPRWKQFLGEIMDGDAEMIDALQRLAGYFLTGDIGVQILPIFYGSGGNGKNVFLDTIMGIMGPYAEEAPDGLISARSNDEHPTEIADLHGKRLVVASETEEGKKMRIGLVKKITGNKYLKGRFMRQDYFQFERTHKTVLVTNNKPVIAETSNAIWRRLRLIPFTVTIAEEHQDRQLTERLVAEWPAIMAWMVRGCIDWQARKCDLEFPETVYQATEAYRSDSDAISDFLAERCVDFREHPDQNMKTPKERIYGAYCKWAHDMGEESISRTAFGRRLRATGFEDRHARICGKTQKCWMDLMLGAVE